MEKKYSIAQREKIGTYLNIKKDTTNISSNTDYKNDFSYDVIDHIELLVNGYLNSDKKEKTALTSSEEQKLIISLRQKIIKVQKEYEKIIVNIPYLEQEQFSEAVKKYFAKIDANIFPSNKTNKIKNISMLWLLGELDGIYFEHTGSHLKTGAYGRSVEFVEACLEPFVFLSKEMISNNIRKNRTYLKRTKI